MSLFHFITLILLSGQVAGDAPQTASDELFGWNLNQDGSLNYIIKMSPQTADALARGAIEEARVDHIPDYVIPSMTSVSLQVGNTPAERVPPAEELKANLATTKSNANLSTLKNDFSNQDKYANIDRKGPSSSRIQPVNQSGASGFGIPPNATSNPAISTAAPPYASTTATSNPALTGSTSASGQYTNPSSQFTNSTPGQFTNSTPGQYSNPAISGRANESLYPTTPVNNDRYANSSSNVSYSELPSVPAMGFNTPSTINSQPLNSPFNSPSTAPAYNRGNENYNYGNGMSSITRAGEPATSGYNYGTGNNQFQNNSGSIRPSTYPGSNALPYSNNGSFVSTRSNQYRDDPQNDVRIASNNNGLLNGSGSSDIADLERRNASLERQLLEAKAGLTRPSIYDDTLTPQKIRDLESSAKLLLWFQLFSIILFVACCFLGGSLYRLYNAYRTLRVTSRHAVHLGV